jgi:hypothetical protein
MRNHAIANLYKVVGSGRLEDSSNFLIKLFQVPKISKINLFVFVFRISPVK